MDREVPRAERVAVSHPPDSSITKPADWFTTAIHRRFAADPSSAGGFEGQFCCRIEGATGGDWTCTIEATSIIVTQGLIAEPRFTLLATDEHFINLVSG